MISKISPLKDLRVSTFQNSEGDQSIRGKLKTENIQNIMEYTMGERVTLGL
jgi:hypothetical protein